MIEPTILTASFAAAAQRHQIPAALAAVADADTVLASCTHGPVVADSIFAVASMTKAITTAAAMQLVERGILHLDEPIHHRLPELHELPILEGFQDHGAPIYSKERYCVTLRQLLTHTAGFAYSWNHPLALCHSPGGRAYLVHEPGTRWHYGTNVDWAGRLVEVASGQNLETYFQQHILQPLGMCDTGFILPPDKFDRLVHNYQRDPNGVLRELPRVHPPPPRDFNGGGGLFSTAPDYVRFMQMILRRGLAADGTRILEEASVLAMCTNQTGELEAGRIISTIPERSCDVDFHPGADDHFGLGFLINPQAHTGGRSAGSLAWGGIRNTFYWIDPHRSLAAVLLMQFQPFCDPAAIALLNDFEHAIYQTS